MRRPKNLILAAAAIGILAIGMAFFLYRRGATRAATAWWNEAVRVDHARHSLTDIKLQQWLFKTTIELDVDGDRIGEFGDMEQLERFDVEHGQPNRWGPRKVPGGYWQLDSKEGYLIKVYVPPDPDTAELHWCAVAWDPSGRFQKSFLVLDWSEGESRYVGYVYGTEIISGEPGLANIYEGAPFVTPVRSDIWKVDELSKPDSERRP